MLIDVTTGVMNDGTIIARTGTLLLDNGAYMADSSFFPQAAAMHLIGPYAIPNVHMDGKLVYTCLLYTSPSPRDRQKTRMPSSA